MPEIKKRQLTPEELRKLGINTDPAEVTPESENKPRTYRGKLGLAGGLITRLATGVGSGILNAIPTPMTLAGSAALSGAGEYAAQKIESPDPVDKSTIAVEAGLGMIPYSKVFKGIKAGKDIAKQLAKNFARGAGAMEAGNIIRRYNSEGELAPQSGAEWAFELGTAGLGGATGLLGGAAAKARAAKAAAEKANIDDVSKYRREPIPRSVFIADEDRPLHQTVKDVAKQRKDDEKRWAAQTAKLESGLDDLVKQKTAANTAQQQADELVNSELRAKNVAEQQAAEMQAKAKQKAEEHLAKQQRAANIAQQQADAMQAKQGTEANIAQKIADDMRRAEKAIAEFKARGLESSEPTLVQRTSAENKSGGKDTLTVLKKEAEEGAEGGGGGKPSARRPYKPKPGGGPKPASEPPVVPVEPPPGPAKGVAPVVDTAPPVAPASPVPELPAASPKAGVPAVKPEPPKYTKTDVAAELDKWSVPQLKNALAKTKNPDMKAAIEEALQRKGPDTPPPAPPAAPVPVKPTPKGPAPAAPAAAVPNAGGKLVPPVKPVTPQIEAPAGSTPLGIKPATPAGPSKALNWSHEKDVPPGTLIQAYGSEGEVLTNGPLGIRVKFHKGPMVEKQGAKGHFDVDPNHIEKIGTGKDLVPKVEPAKPTAPAGPEKGSKAWKAQELAKAEAKIAAEVKEATPEKLKELSKSKDPQVRKAAADELATRQSPVGTKPVEPAVAAKAEAPVTAPPAEPVKPAAPPPPPKPTKVTIDLAGAKDSKEVKNRILNELTKYKQKIAKAAESIGIDEKGKEVGRVTQPDLIIEVPNGPTYRIAEHQVDNAIERFEKGLPGQGYGPKGVIKTETAMKGIVDAPEKRPKMPSLGKGAAPIVAKPNISKAKTPATAAILDDKNKTLADVDKAMGKPAPEYKPVHQEYIRHQSLAAKWLEYHNQKPTEKNLVKTMQRLSADKLKEMLAKRGITEAKQASPLVEAGGKASKPIPQGTPVKADTVTDINAAHQAHMDAAIAYGKMKDAVTAGTATTDDLRAAGKLYGETQAALAKAVKAAEAAGGDIPVYAKPVPKPEVPKAAKVKKPKGKGPTSDDIAAMPPEEQDKVLTDVVNKFKGRKKVTDETGAIQDDPDFTLRVLLGAGAGSAGAAYGAVNNPEDRLTGALIGFGVGAGTGFYAPVAFNAAVKHLSNNPNEDSKKKVADWVLDHLATAREMMPDYYRASVLSKPSGLAMNAIVGPMGGVIMGGIEAGLSGDKRGWKAVANAYKVLSEYPKSWREAGERVAEANERVGGIGQHGPESFRWAVSQPAQALTAGDIAARKVLTDAGFSELEARNFNLTSEPFSGLGKGIGNMMKSKGQHGHQSWALRMVLPFYRTNINQLEQNMIRLPGLGPMFHHYWKVAPIDAKLSAARQAISFGTGAGSYLLGSIIPEDKQKGMIKLLNNFGGVYGTTMSLAFIAGASRQKGDPVHKQLATAATGLLRRDAPLPNTDLAFDILKTFNAVLDNKKSTQADIPYGVIPPVLSSKEVNSLPTMMREGFGKVLSEIPPEWAGGAPTTSKPTKYERSILAAPMFDEFMGGPPELKKDVTTMTPGQRAIKRQQERIKELRSRQKERMQR